uniref:E3 ubiquitin-protein ligase TRIP12 n=1 Tax=Macrostomum lignano TaxID=282301 RepID=A0A1I8G1F9_9PLAT
RTSQEPRTSSSSRRSQEPRTSSSSRTSQEPRTSSSSRTSQEPRTSSSSRRSQEPRTSSSSRLDQQRRMSKTGSNPGFNLRASPRKGSATDLLVGSGGSGASGASASSTTAVAGGIGSGDSLLRTVIRANLPESLRQLRQAPSPPPPPPPQHSHSVPVIITSAPQADCSGGCGGGDGPEEANRSFTLSIPSVQQRRHSLTNQMGSGIQQMVGGGPNTEIPFVTPNGSKTGSRRPSTQGAPTDRLGIAPNNARRSSFNALSDTVMNLFAGANKPG